MLELEGEGTVNGRREDLLDEGGCDDDTGTEVAGEEVDIDIDLEPFDASGDDREEGKEEGSQKDDEDGRDSSAEAAIVRILTCVQEADDIARVCGGQVDLVGVEVGHCPVDRS